MNVWSRRIAAISPFRVKSGYFVVTVGGESHLKFFSAFRKPSGRRDVQVTHQQTMTVKILKRNRFLHNFVPVCKCSLSISETGKNEIFLEKQGEAKEIKESATMTSLTGFPPCRFFVFVQVQDRLRCLLRPASQQRRKTTPDQKNNIQGKRIDRITYRYNLLLNPNMDIPNSQVIPSPGEITSQFPQCYSACFIQNSLNLKCKNFTWCCLFGFSGTNLYFNTNLIN